MLLPAASEQIRRVKADGPDLGAYLQRSEKYRCRYGVAYDRKGVETLLKKLYFEQFGK